MRSTDHLLNQAEGLAKNIAISLDEIKIELLAKEDEFEVSQLIRRNLEQFGSPTEVLGASLNRLKKLAENYSREGYRLFVAKNSAAGNIPIGCAGLGPLKGLPVSERIGEICDMVVELPYRSQGVGSRLLHRCIAEAKQIGYQRLYLETSTNMIQARKLFLRSGFRPVTEKNLNTLFSPSPSELPCYFLLEDLSRT